MNKPLSLLLRCLGLNRPAPKTRFGRHVRRSERVLGVLCLLYLGLQLFPQALFAYNVTANNITIYSRAPLPPQAMACTARAAELLKQSELAVPGRHERIFVCDSPWLLRLFGPNQGDAFGFSVPLTDNGFVAAADYTNDLVRRAGRDFNTRSLSSVMAHEITHGLIRHRLGWLRGLLLPDWVAEGYCDYVARESSFPAAEGLRLFESGQGDPSASYRYFTYRQMVRYLVEQQHLNFSQVVARAGDATNVEAEAREAIESEERK